MIALLYVDDPESDELRADLRYHALIDADEALDDKLSSAIHVITQYEAAAVSERARAARILRFARAREHDAERLRAWVSSCLAEIGETRRSCGEYQITVAAGPPKVMLDDSFLAWAAAERDDLLRYEDPRPDKIAIKRALADGEVIPGARLVETLSLRWR
jgi:prophage antirepressor-like protein